MARTSVASNPGSWHGLQAKKWKLDSYRRYDATRDPRDEPYCETACKIFRAPSGTYTKTSPERNIGKTCDLAFGYMGGLNAWRKFEPERFSDAEVEAFKKEWRAAHPAIPIGFGSTDEFIQLMTRKPAWALDLPIAANAWTGARYTK